MYFNTFMIICLFLIKIQLQTHTRNAEITRRLYSVHAARPQRAHHAPTALFKTLQRCHSVLKHAVETPSRGVCFEHAQNKRRRMAFVAIAQRFYSVAGVCTARTSAFCIFLNAVGTLSGRHSGVTGV